jgi:putative sterol carrier protein
VLSELLAEDPECADAVEEILSEVTTYSVGVFVPPNWDMRYIECFGSTMEEVYVHGMQSLETKMRTAGFPLERLARAFSFSPDTPHEERARRAVRLLQANIVGEKNGPPSKDPEIMAMLFDSVKNRVDPSQLSNGGVTIQWDFEDADPWFLRVDNGATSVEQGRLEDPELTFRCRYEDWVDVAAGREDPRLAMAKRKLRPKGLLTLLRTRKLFG